MLPKVSKEKFDKMPKSQMLDYSTMLSPICTMIHPLHPVDSLSLKGNDEVLETTRTIRHKLSPVNSKADKASSLMSNPMSLNLFIASYRAGEQTKIEVTSASLKYSARTPTSLLKRGHNISSSIWQRLTQQKCLHENQVNEAKPNLKPPERDCLVCLPMKVDNVEMEGQMGEIRHCPQSRETMNLENGGNSSQVTCHGTARRGNSLCRKP